MEAMETHNEKNINIKGPPASRRWSSCGEKNIETVHDNPIKLLPM